MGGCTVSPPHFSDPWGGTRPPIFPDHGGRNRHNLWGGRFFCQMAEMGGCRFLVSPPHNYGGETVHPPIIAPQAKIFWVSPPIYGGKCRFFAKLCLILGMCTPPYRMGGRHLPPHIFRRWGGNRFLPPIFPDHGGGTAPPHIFLDMGGYRHLWLEYAPESVQMGN